MDLLAWVAATATVLGALQLAPQLLRSVRLQSTVGLSLTWASVGLLLNMGWVAYRLSQELWASVASPAISAVLYGTLLLLVLRSARPTARLLGALAVVLGSLGLAALVGGWALLGIALGTWAGIQVAPAVWSTYRAGSTAAVAPALWVAGLAQAALWAYYGLAIGDMTFLVYGAGTGLGSLAILARLIAAPGAPFRPIRRTVRRIAFAATRK